MFPVKVARAAGTGASVPVECCQICGHGALETVLIPNASNPELKDLLSTRLKIFQGHQAHAEHLVETLR